MSNAVEQIIANYAGENPGVIGNLRRLLNTGTLAGTGKLVILSDVTLARVTSVRIALMR